MKPGFYLLLYFGFLFSCSSDKQDQFLFTQMESSITGINFSNDLTETDEFNMVEYLYFNNGGGVSAGDINNDGLIDLYFSANQLPNKLYLNKGNMIFDEITSSAGVAGQGNWATGVTMADVNGDGYLDIYVCNLGNYKGREGRNQLFINNGDLTFTDMAEDFGLAFIGFSTQASFFDFDLDGDLDMYLLNHSVHTAKNYGPSSLRQLPDPMAGDRLFRNDKNLGKSIFKDITRDAGIYSSAIGYGLAASIGDINNDGHPDIYISNDFHENDYLYINQGDGTFMEKSTDMMAYSSRSSMGNDIGDINNDGLLDVMVLDMLPEKEEIRQRSGGEDSYDVYDIKRNYGYNHQFVRNTLQLNLGDAQFCEIGRLAGIFATDWSWSPLFCDLDNDGLKDIFITNGIFRRANDLDYVSFLSEDKRMRGSDLSELSNKSLYEKMPLEPLVNYVYKNNGDLTFTNNANGWGINSVSYSNGASYADLDNDGDLDVVVNNINEKAFIYRNNSNQQSENHFLKIRFHGDTGNPFGIGARITLYIDEAEYIGENYTTRGFLSSVPPELHFGLGSAVKIDSVDIMWPCGKRQRLFDVLSNQSISVRHDNSEFISDPGDNIDISTKLFTEASEIIGFNLEHTENKFIDFIREPLMPHNLSSEGPAIAVGDINGDGIDDIFMGGARGQRSILLKQSTNGFEKTNIDLFRQDFAFEDVDATFFDADGDDDLDLYVVSGSNEKLLPDKSMKDRLYINDGFGNFSKSDGMIPDLSHNGSCVAIADYDLDGDEDLFIGSRSIPGAYGLSPESYLLENTRNGIFKKAGLNVKEKSANPGMVTDAAWADIDGDNYPELIVVGEWMPITIFKNSNGSLISNPHPITLENTGGWWFSIEASDIDSDGDMDFIAGNLGLNSFLKANPQSKLHMYINDFDKDGSIEQVITIVKSEQSYPLASRDELAERISMIEDNYNTYAEFAGQTLQEIFSEEQLQEAIKKEVETFETALFINNGKGKFEHRALPVEIQFAPVMDIMLDDYDLDGQTDIVLGGNFNSVKPSMGRYDASYGWFLKGMGEGEFSVFSPGQSGFNVKGEIRKIKEINIKDKKYLVIGVNNQKVVPFRLNNN